MAPSRKASHAGSWYSSSPSQLRTQLTSWLSAVPTELPSPLTVCQASPTTTPLPLPIAGSRAIIAPHAGYSYSGPAAAYAYSTIDTSTISTVFVLGPSHHVYLDGCALTACETYETPLGDLPVDRALTEELAASGQFSVMTQEEDEDEHSLELHLPYIRHVFPAHIKIVPILVGAINTAKEQEYGRLLAKYLADEKCFFVVSSDFCHWGSRFRYTHYRPDSGPPISLSSRTPREVTQGKEIHQSIRELDEAGILAITHPSSPTGDKTAEQARDQFAHYLRETKNTVCGRHPIGVLLSALAQLETAGTATECRFTRYEQSSACIAVGDSSVSYASAFVRFRP